MKDKGSVQTYKDISSRVSTEVDPNTQIDEKTSQDFFRNIGTPQEQRLRKEQNETYIKDKNEKIELQIIY